jgi:hypothetical protein
MSFPNIMADIPSEFWESLTFGGASIPCIQSEVSEDIRIAEGGLDLNDELSLAIKIANSVPEGGILTYRGESWRVIRVVTDSAHSSRRLYLGRPYSGGR